MFAGDEIILQDQNPSRGFQSSMDYVMNIGLGKKQNLDSLRVIWPDNATQLLENVKANQTLVLDHSEAKDQFKIRKQTKSKTLLTEVSNDKLESHSENQEFRI